ncbi:GNAT family N-acetyltransferase [Actinoplanes sp. NPDC048967]|uniref:GNAT family N-acetyltransferase n=1 Tax=Actinoplanes sp. NPDC048967 TaxID=3155269 RepID=UPI00340CF7F4
MAASIEDHQAIVNLIKGAASWLPTKGTDQWAKPWPSLAERDERIRQGLETESTWMVWDGATAVATITSFRHGSTLLWTAEERRLPAVYLNRVCINRDYAGQGIGARLIDWASGKAAAEYGAQVSRIDVWSTNFKLHDYYRGIGFRFLRRVDDSLDYPSGALFERPIAARCLP